MKRAKQLVSISLFTISAAWLVSCRPGPMDPPMDYNYQRQVVEPSDWQDNRSASFEHVGARALWEQTQQSNQGSEVIIAMIGTGMDYTNPDLRNALWLNTGELGDQARRDQLDNDRNGYVDDVFGYDFYSGDALPYDWHGHDSFTASVIAAPGLQNESVRGLAPNARLMVLRYLGPDGRGAALDAALALEYAAKNRADVVYFNWPNGGFAGSDAAIIESIRKLKQHNILVVIPAGNTANQNMPHLIASGELQKMDHVLIVGAENLNRNLTSKSNRGVNLVSLSALSTGWSGYLNAQEVTSDLDNTAVAAAVVTAAAARLRRLPGQGKVSSIRNLLLQSVATDTVQANLAQGGLKFSH